MSTKGVLQTMKTEAEFDEMYCEQSVDMMRDQILLLQQKIDAIRNAYLTPISIELSTYLDHTKVDQLGPIVGFGNVTYGPTYNITNISSWAIDSTSTPNLYMYNVNQLTPFEGQTCKIYDSTSGLYIDVTNEMNTGNYNDVPLPPFQTAHMGDMIFLGHSVEFYQVTLTIGTAGKYDNISIVWEYSMGGGNWGPLVFRGVHGSTNFKSVGTNRFTFNMPHDWATDLIDGMQAFWIRARSSWIHNADITVAPLGNQGWTSTGWDDDSVIENCIARWAWGYDYIYHSPGTSGSYGLQPQITSLNSAIQITNANKVKYRDSKTYFTPYI